MQDAMKVQVLSCLADSANDEGQGRFVGVSRIAKLMRQSHCTVQQTMDALEKSGWLTMWRGDGAEDFTCYEINVERLKGSQDATLRPRGLR
jgi:hypothetical protein